MHSHPCMNGVFQLKLLDFRTGHLVLRGTREFPQFVSAVWSSVFQRKLLDKEVNHFSKSVREYDRT
jgi:hypothetical protein